MKFEIQYHPSERQRRYHEAEADELLYGGAAGGGKSTATVIDAFKKACVNPGRFYYCFRRTYSELEDTLISEAKKWYPDGGGFKWVMGPPPTYYLPNGAEVRFRHCQYETDLDKYQSAEMAGLYIDEAGHFKYKMADTLCARVRMSGKHTSKPQAKFTANPGGPGHGWLKEKFQPGLRDNGIVRIKTHSEYLNKDIFQTVQFIPAKVKDNPHLSDEYIVNLENRNEGLRQAWLFGDWDSFEGQAFKEWRNIPDNYDSREMTHVINPFPIPKHWKIFRSYDYGKSAPYSVLWWAIGDDMVDGRIYLIKELYGANPREFNTGLFETAYEQAYKIYQIEHTPQFLRFKDTNGVDRQVIINMQAHGTIQGVADPRIWDNSAGLNLCIGEMMAGAYYQDEAGRKVPTPVVFIDARWDPEAKPNVINNRLQGKAIFHEVLRMRDDKKPLLQVFCTCPNFIKHIPELVTDIKNPEDVATDGVEDHDYDASRYMLMKRKPHLQKKTQRMLRQEVGDPDPLDMAPPQLKIYGS